MTAYEIRAHGSDYLPPSAERDDAVVALFAQHERGRLPAPTVRRVCDLVGITSSSTGHAYLARLVRLGLLEQVVGEPGARPSYRLVAPPAGACPLCGRES